MADQEPHEGEWKPLVSFEDQSPSHVHGFENGMIWQQMQDQVPEFSMVVHVENRVTIHRLAAAAGYKVALAPTGLDGWDQMEATMLPRRGPLSVVK